MRLNVLIAPDKFKGTLSARSAAAAIARGWSETRPQDRLKQLPITDGGEGFGGVLGRLIHAVPRRVLTVDAAHRPRRATWWWEPRSRTAVIESAAAIGLALLPPGKFHPFDLDTEGVAPLIRAAYRAGARTCIIGLGGSATNEGGFGMLRGLGWQFLGPSDREIRSWMDLTECEHIVHPIKPFKFARCLVAVDVENPLLGKRGATRTYGPQKGLIDGDFECAENNLKVLARMRPTAAAMKGAGAAGGLAFGLAVGLNASLVSGFQLFAEHAKLAQLLARTDLVISGEGRLDLTSSMGKGVGELAKRCQDFRVPVVALAGEITNAPKVTRLFAAAHALTELTGAADAQTNPGRWLAKLASLVAEGAEGVESRVPA